MNALQNVRDTSDVVPLYLPQQLFLKPIAKVNISIQLPNVKKTGKSVSHWEIMEKLRELVKPDEFTVLKVVNTTVEFVRFTAELESKSKIERALTKLDNRMVKLKDFNEMVRVKAAAAKTEFPNRKIWDEFFQNAKDMDEMKPGERPDTIYIYNIPKKWFCYSQYVNDEDAVPSEKIFYKIFEKFGKIRFVDIPVCDPFRKKMKDHISGFKQVTENTDVFEGYIQFKDYIGFNNAMDALRDMKLLRKNLDEEMTSVDMKVDFDKSKHLSDASIRRREIVRERLVKKAREKEEKEKKELEDLKKTQHTQRQREVDLKKQKEIRRKLREEKRKARLLKKLEVTGSDEINEKIAKEEKKLLGVQRKLEAIRLVEELFKRIKDKQPDDIRKNDTYDSTSRHELNRYKNASELDVLSQKEKLHNFIKGRAMLKTILSDGTERRKRRSSSESSLSLDEYDERDRNGHPRDEIQDAILKSQMDMQSQLNLPNWFGFPAPVPYQMPQFTPYRYYNPSAMERNIRGGFGGPPRGPFRGGRGNYRGRGGYRGGRNNYDPEYDNKHPTKYLRRDSRSRSRSRSHDHTHSRSQRSYTRERSRSRSRSRGRGRRSYSRSRSRSYSRNRSRSNSKEKSYSKRSQRKSRDDRSKTRERSKSREKSRNRTKSRDKSKSREKSKSRGGSKSRDRSKTRDRSKSRNRSKTRDRSKSRGRSKSRERSKSRDKSVDSSHFMTPQQLKDRRSRSKSWSLPKDGERQKSWSKTP